MGFGSLGEGVTDLKLSRAGGDFGYADMRMSLTGFVELDAMFNELTNMAKGRVIIAPMRKILNPIRDRAKASTPVDSGRLKKSISISKKFNKQSGFAQASLGFRTRGSKAAPHAHLIEWGTEDRFTPIVRYTLLGGTRRTGEERETGSVAPQKNMTRAFKSSGGSNKAKKLFREELGKAILRAHKKKKNRRWKLI